MRSALRATHLSLLAATIAASALVAQEARLIDVGGHRLEAVVMGEGSPTVVLDAGFSGGLRAWQHVQAAVSRHAQTIAYDRAGLGGSEVGPEPRTARRIASELHALLDAAEIRGPVILVGHSAGGMFIRVYAHAYPDRVAGLVFVDPATEGIYQNMRTRDPERWLGFAHDVRPTSPGWAPQWDALPTSMEQASEAWPLPAVPMAVLTALELLPGEWALESPEYMSVWAEEHRRLVEKLGASQHIVIEEADHLTILDEPILVETILEMVRVARSAQPSQNKQLPPSR